MKADWKTTLGGVLIAAGGGLQAMDDPIMKSTGAILIGIGGFITGLFSKDSV